MVTQLPIMDNSLSRDLGITSGQRDNYEIYRKIGRGKYGEVFEAFNITNNKRCAVKVLKAIKKEKIGREIAILRRLSGGPNIVRLRDVLLDCGTPALVFHYSADHTFKDVWCQLSDYEIRLYLYKLLRALHYAHSQGVIHRDVKPSNIMVDLNKRSLRLIDWGLAEMVDNKKTFSVCVASRCYKSPEILLGNKEYEYELDMWSFGCILAACLFRREPFFNGYDYGHQLKEIVTTLGTEGLRQYIDKHKLQVSAFVETILEKPRERQLWTQYVSEPFKHIANESAIDLCDGLLTYDGRHTSAEALSHPYFEIVRNHNI